MRKRVEKKFWFSMFLSYSLITLLCFLMYTLAVLISSYELGQREYAQENERTVDKVQALLEQKTNAVTDMISNINNSTLFKPLFLSMVEESEIGLKDKVNMQNGLKTIYSRNISKGLDDLILFPDNSTTAYTGSGILSLSAPFEHMSFPTVYCTLDSVSNLVDVDNEKYSFNRTNLLFARSFSHEGGSEKGVIVISFDLTQFSRSLDSLTKEAGYSLSFNDVPLMSSDSFDENLTTVTIRDKNVKALCITLSFSPYTFVLNGSWVGIYALVIGAVVFIGMLMLSLHFSLNYYKPFKRMRSIVPTTGRMEGNEVNAMISELEDMVVEYEEYRNNLSDIAPYVEKGLFHRMITGRKPDREGYAAREFGFVKPFFYIIAVHFETNDGDMVEEALVRLKKLFFEKEETRVSFYRRDDNNAFIAINTDRDDNQSETVDRIFDFLDGAMDKNGRVTFGVDIVRTDLSSLRAACNSALSALEKMLVQGKGDIYYSEDGDTSEDEGYYLPSGLEAILMRSIREDRDDEGEKVFDEILHTNLMKYDLSAKTVRALSDELYYSVVRCGRGLGLSVSSPKPDSDSTIEEVFAYCRNLYIRVRDIYRTEEAKDKNTYAPLLDFVEENYAMPDLSLKLLSDMFHISQKTITGCFMKQTGMTYLKYVTMKRIAKAKDLLSTTDSSIDSIALLCGYSSTLSFRRNFKDETGLTPSEYRMNGTR